MNKQKLIELNNDWDLDRGPAQGGPILSKGLI